MFSEFSHAAFLIRMEEGYKNYKAKEGEVQGASGAAVRTAGDIFLELFRESKKTLTLLG